jgi:hypothetical protein
MPGLDPGIHVHVHNGTVRIVDETFSEVVLAGKKLSRSDLIDQMVARTVT